MSGEHEAAVPTGAVAVHNTYPGANTAEVVVGNVMHYAKILVYIAISAIGVLIVGVQGGQSRPLVTVNVAVALLGAVLVYLVPNFNNVVGQYAKVIIAFLIAALQALLPFWITGQVSWLEWLQVAVTAFAAIGVYVTPNGVKNELRVVPVAVQQ